MPSTIVEHKKCICVEFGDTNNNKFWEYTIFSDGSCETAWGRVGGHVTRRPTPEIKALKKWGEKTNSNNKPDKRYTEIKAVDTGSSVSISSVKNTELKDVAKKQIKSKNPIVAKLVDFLVDVNAHNIMKQSGGGIVYDASSAQFKTPLGVIAPDQVAEARNLLVDISDFVKIDDFDNKQFDRTLNSYLRLIPHDVGMFKISPKRIFPNSQTVIAENDLLDGLDSSFIDVTTFKSKKAVKKKTAPKIFDVNMEIVEDRKTLSYIKNLYQSTRKSMHQSNNLSVKTVYKIEIKDMKKAFNRYGETLSNIKQLWHGTSASNLLSILKKGLVIPSSNSRHCTGRMWMDGAYFSDISTKSLNYATNYWNSGGNTDRTFMFLCSVAMGKTYIPDSYLDGPFPKKGYDSVFAKAGISGVHNNEMIIYRLDQCNLVYLIEFATRNN